jgi:hypothetical protein
MLSTPMRSRRRMQMASSWKLSTMLRRKKSLGSMPLEPVNRLAVVLAEEKTVTSVPFCNLGDEPLICWRPEGLVPHPFVVGASDKVQCFSLAG